jgi:hypothetical protein
MLDILGFAKYPECYTDVEIGHYKVVAKELAIFTDVPNAAGLVDSVYYGISLANRAEYEFGAVFEDIDEEVIYWRGVMEEI